MERLADGTLAGMTHDEAIERARQLAAKHERAYVAYLYDVDASDNEWRVVSNKSHIAKPLAEPSGIWYIVGVTGHADFSGNPWFRNPPNPDALPPEQIRERRTRMHMTQEQLADRLGVARKTVNEWERAHAPVPKWLTLALDRLSQLTPAAE